MDPDFAAKYARALTRPASDNLHALFKTARENPHDDTVHGAVADALEEEFPGSPIPELIRKQLGLGQHREPQNNLWYEPVENSWDGTFPYAARLGKHGPFDLYLRHEGHSQQGDNQRWVLHAVSNLKGSRDFGYTFEFPHESAHTIPQLFPTASRHIDRTYHIDHEDDPVAVDVHRNQEARQFETDMDTEESNR